MLEQGTLLPEKIDKPRATVRDLTAVSQVLCTCETASTELKEFNKVTALKTAPLFTAVFFQLTHQVKVVSIF